MRHEILTVDTTSKGVASSAKRSIWTTSALVIALGWLNEAYLHVPLLALADIQASLANWIEPILLALAAGLFLIASRAASIGGGSDARYWAGLSILFTLLSLDEASNLHELILKPLRSAVGAEPVLVWMSPAFVGVLAAAVYFAPLLKHLPVKFARRFALSALVFVGGCIVVEAISQYIAVHEGVASLGYRTSACVEETLEIVGATMLCSYLIDYLQTRWHTIVVQKAYPKCLKRLG
ncbi:hypothetical protein SAMN05216330_104461 [Bradyrhizobium sp. Ghvi]|uniref:hypothetical protein n=1 Tax=Bradyrhizobium sp. Ghvi TaxID=1855319 RepID=UPI0008E7BBF9|nr:hypothetical protein [Bradyrhizobium sp. Ghvi]SFO74413.1 hypothetical protein SAMN05216330_104461 [Bradyrhizobium sp. Ghvi]